MEFEGEHGFGVAIVQGHNRLDLLPNVAKCLMNII
jgi:hypothetical protein